MVKELENDVLRDKKRQKSNIFWLTCNFYPESSSTTKEGR